MTLRLFASPALALLLAVPAAAQTTPPPPPAFLAADVHLAPRRSYPFFFAVMLPENRYVVRDASMLDLIATAWDLPPESVQGGPPWLELDRFDIVARVPAGASKVDQRLMLRSLLGSRFHLSVNASTRPLPAFVLSPGKPTVTPSTSTAEARCQDKPQPAGSAFTVISCRNLSMPEFALHLRDLGALDKPVVDATGLQGTYDFELKWTGRGAVGQPGALPLADAIAQQLGLKLTLETVPRPVILVVTADRRPTPNADSLEDSLGGQPLPLFEVATIKTANPDSHGNGQIGGGRVDFKGVPLKDLIDLAWDLNESDPEVLVNAPKWLAERRFDILAKTGADATGIPIAGRMPMDLYQVELMLRALLIERFQIKAHLEDRPIDAYTLLSTPSPKLTPAADTSSRSRCEARQVSSPNPNPALNQHLRCRNISLADLCEQLQRLAGAYLFAPVLDATEIKGTFDIALNFTGAGEFQRALETAPAGPDATPPAVLSLFEAVNRQLGLRLEKSKRRLPVLVLDHIEEKPTEN